MHNEKTSPTHTKIPYRMVSNTSPSMNRALCLNLPYSGGTRFQLPQQLQWDLLGVIISKRPTKCFTGKGESATMMNANLSLRDRKQFKRFEMAIFMFQKS